MEPNTRIFLSYARKDIVKVNKLYDDLKSYGFSPWQDHKDLIGGDDWMKEVIDTINESACFLACISRHTIDRETGVLVREINEGLEVAKSHRGGFIIPVRFENVNYPKELKKYHGIDLFETDGLQKLIKALRYRLKKLGIDNPLNLRSQPIDNLKGAEAAQMIREQNFYDSSYWPGAGIHHEYKTKTINGAKVVIDHTTGLMWQQGGSERTTLHAQAKDYFAELNDKKFAGFTDWRLPTLEEVMSLVEAKKSDNDLYIDSVFDKTQRWIWTADKNNSASRAWFVGFDFGICTHSRVDFYSYGRAVRSGQSS